MTGDDRKRMPDLLVEQLVLDELSDQRRKDAMAELTAQGGLTRLDAVAASNETILRQHPPAEQARTLAAQIDNQRRVEAAHKAQDRRNLAYATIPVAVAAAIIALVIWGPWSGADSGSTVPGVVGADADDGIRLKGDARLMIHRVVDGQAHALANGDAAAAGDVLQLSYLSPTAGYGVIVSVDGGGTVTVHFPDPSDASNELGEGKVQLGFAYQLDAAPNFERFFFVTSAKPIDVNAVLGAARDLAGTPAAADAPLTLPTGYQQMSLRLDKEARP